MTEATDWMWGVAPDPDVDIGSILDLLGLRSSPEQLSLLGGLREHYREAGLLPDHKNKPLWECCCDRGRCWKGVPTEQMRTDFGGITLPWVGPDYHMGGVVVLGHNLRDAGGLFVEQIVASQVRWAFSEGHKKVHGSVFAFRSMTAVAALLAAADRRESPVLSPSPDTLLRAIDSCARLQSVKCSPKDGFLSQPTAAMSELCPERYLRKELEILAPKVLLVLGRAAQTAVERLFPEGWDQRKGLPLCTVYLEAGTCEIFCLAHPAARGHWWPKWNAFERALERE